MRRAVTLLLTLLALLSAAPGVPGPPLKQGDDCKPENDRGNRCEGLISIQTGNPNLEVLSFTAGGGVKFAGDVVLKVKFFQDAPESLSIIAQELDPKRLYFMRVKQTQWLPARMWHEFGPWPTADVISKERIPDYNLGVLIRSDETHLRPALVYYSTPPASITKYRMQLRAGKNFDAGEVKLYGNGANQSKTRTSYLPHVQVNKAVGIDIDASGFREGLLSLTVKLFNSTKDGKVDEASVATETYTFYHKPETR